MKSLDEVGSLIPEGEGLPFQLADGKFWRLATPRVYLKPCFTPDPNPENPGKMKVELRERWDYPRPAREKVRALIDAVCSEDSPTFALSVVVDAALALLLMCHDLSREDAIELFDMTRDEIENLAVYMLRMFRGDWTTKSSEEPEPSESLEIESD